jgi:hypothetical protein
MLNVALTMEEVNKAKRTMAAKGAASPTMKWLPQ